MVINYVLPDGSFHQFTEMQMFLPQKGDIVYFDLMYIVSLIEHVHKKGDYYYTLKEINIHLELFNS
jgi:hypothetical protein